MKAYKEWVVPLRGAYAVTQVATPHGKVVFAGTEQRGPIILIEHQIMRRVQTVIEGPGGVMQIARWPSSALKIAAIVGFYPPFRAADAEVIVITPSDDSYKTWQYTTIVKLPFAHRMGFITNGKRYWLVVSTIAETKSDPEDWSRPGAVWAFEIESREEARCYDGVEILHGVHKNHGMLVKDKHELYISGQEGLFCISPPQGSNSIWRHEILIEREISDFCFGDIDGDGKEEIITIEPLHGDSIYIYKFYEDRWIPITEHPANFAHVVWCGVCGNRRLLIIGNRRGRADLAVLSYDQAASRLKTEVIVDEGAGPSQISVLSEGMACQIVSANNGGDEVAFYRIANVL